MMSLVSPEPSIADTPRQALATVYRYHDGTKHHFQRFARSLGYLDWASQPHPFREFTNAPVFPLYPRPGVPLDGYVPHRATFDEACQLQVVPWPLSAAAIGDMLRHSLGLSAWKRFNASRWALRVNPSSGNLHPTEAYVITGPLSGLADRPAVYHYAADRHALEMRCRFDEGLWERAFGGRRDVLLVALTSIHWREAWKYGERAFRYCQHDLGHASAAVSIAAGLVGWRTSLLPAWSHRAIAAVTGLDREEDFAEAEREEPGAVLAVTAGAPLDDAHHDAVGPLVEGISGGQWSGRASQLSEDHVTWSFIDEIARATEDPGRPYVPVFGLAIPDHHTQRDRQLDARALLRQRRSALAFDGRTTMDRGTFLDMLASVLPSARTPWTSLWWAPRIHLAIFVQRVDEVPPGVYLLVRDSLALSRLRAACRPDLLWELVDHRLPLWCLARADVRALAARVSCDQDVAADGFFSLGMLGDFDSLQAFGASFYRHLFWETGMVGHVLYLEAEAIGARGTGIGCFYDDPVHDILGLHGHTFQSLYHFTVGKAVDDARLTTEPGYDWEKIDR
jgi:SagB-type dehydrogenase family enzyme